MSVLYSQASKSKYRITLEIDALSDYNPHQIDWHKVLDMQDNEEVNCYIEDMSNPVSWE